MEIQLFSWIEDLQEDCKAFTPTKKKKKKKAGSGRDNNIKNILKDKNIILLLLGMVDMSFYSVGFCK